VWNLAIVQYLLESKIKWEIHDSVTPLGEAGRHGYYDIVKLLLTSDEYPIYESEYVIFTFLLDFLPKDLITIVVKFFGSFYCSKCKIPAAKAYRITCHGSHARSAAPNHIFVPKTKDTPDALPNFGPIHEVDSDVAVNTRLRELYGMVRV